MRREGFPWRLCTSCAVGFSTFTNAVPLNTFPDGPVSVAAQDFAMMACSCMRLCCEFLVLAVIVLVLTAFDYHLHIQAPPGFAIQRCKFCNMLVPDVLRVSTNSAQNAVLLGFHVAVYFHIFIPS